MKSASGKCASPLASLGTMPMKTKLSCCGAAGQNHNAALPMVKKRLRNQAIERGATITNGLAFYGPALRTRA